MILASVIQNLFPPPSLFFHFKIFGPNFRMLKDSKVEHISHSDYISVSIFKLLILLGCDNHLSFSVFFMGPFPSIRKLQ